MRKQNASELSRNSNVSIKMKSIDKLVSMKRKNFKQKNYKLFKSKNVLKKNKCRQSKTNERSHTVCSTRTT